MPSASSSWSGAPGRRRLGALAVGLATLALVAGGTSGGPPPADPTVASYRMHAALEPAQQKRLRTSAWLGGTFTASTGEAVRVLVSDEYADPQLVGQQWADYFASLLHGSELGLMSAYVLTPDEMSLFCGPHALGCYGGNELAFIGETVSGVTPKEVAAHEYGHHVAANRLNPPWLAVTWGPKRWASAANICARAQQGLVHPGNEDDHYELNPGEGFAEVYRVLNEVKAGATSFSWSLVDPSFSPDAAALQAAEQDVTTPWSAPASQAFRGRLGATGPKVWKVTVPTQLDGGLALSLTFPKGSLFDLALLGTDGRVLGRGLWSGLAEKKLTTTVCGQRSVVVRVTRGGPPGRFALRVTRD